MTKHLGMPIGYKKIDLDEIQSLELREISEHKVRQAFDLVGSPVLVEDVSLTINSLGKLPGPLVKWFLQEIGNEGLCRLADLGGDRSGSVAISYAYFDGKTLKFFDGQEEGTIARSPRGDSGFGWNEIFIPNNSQKTYAEMDEAETANYSLRSPVLPKIKKFLAELDKIN